MWFSLYVTITKAIIKIREMRAKAILLINDKINNCNNTSSNIQITSLSFKKYEMIPHSAFLAFFQNYTILKFKCQHKKQTKVLKIKFQATQNCDAWNFIWDTLFFLTYMII